MVLANADLFIFYMATLVSLVEEVGETAFPLYSGTRCVHSTVNTSSIFRLIVHGAVNIEHRNKAPNARPLLYP